jgi:hypothetical protein
LSRTRRVRNPHVATAVAACWQRTVSPQHFEERLFEVIVTAQDDPFIPFESFHHPAIVGNWSITLVAPEHGGHLCVHFTERRTRALLGRIARGGVLCRALGDREVHRAALEIWRLAYPGERTPKPSTPRGTQVSAAKTIRSFSSPRGVVSFRAQCFALGARRGSGRDPRPAATVLSRLLAQGTCTWRP